MERKEHALSVFLLQKAISAKPDDICTALQLATYLDPFPVSVAAADESYRRSMSQMDFLSSFDDLPLDPRTLALIPMAAQDPYVHCGLSSIFSHSFYYRGDPKAALSKFTSVVLKAFPKLKYETSGLPPSKPDKKKVVDRRIRLGIASGFLTEGSSVSEDFKGVLQRLDRDLFDITYFVFVEGGHAGSPIANFVLKDKHFIFSKNQNGYYEFLEDARKQIEDAELDILYYLDLTVSVSRLNTKSFSPCSFAAHTFLLRTDVIIRSSKRDG